MENSHSGQFARYLRSETGFAAHSHIRKYDGEPFMPHHVVEGVLELLQGEADLFLFVRAMVRLRLPSDPTSRWAPLPSAIRFGATSVRLRLSLQTQGMPGTRRGGGRLAPQPPTCSGAGHLSGPGSGERLVAGRDMDLLRSRRCRPPVPGSAAAS